MIVLHEVKFAHDTGQGMDINGHVNGELQPQKHLTCKKKINRWRNRERERER
jgi:hypothetical protein